MAIQGAEEIRKSGQYKLSFTVDALMFKESCLAVDAFFETGGWVAAREVLITENRLQSRMLTTAKRLVGEVIKRLKALSDEQLCFFRSASRGDRSNLLWFAICKRYRFVADFAIEVVREKYLRLDYLLLEEDFQSFFNKKSEWHVELEVFKRSRFLKVRQVLFRMLREAGIIDENHRILASFLSDEFKEQIQKGENATFAIFPVAESLLQGGVCKAR